jgi:hypothetical protein
VGSAFRPLRRPKGPTHRIACNLCTFIASSRSQDEVFRQFEEHVQAVHADVIKAGDEVTLDAVEPQSADSD